MSSQRIIIRQNTRIFSSPVEYQEFRRYLNPMYQIIADVLLNTGMRIVEFWAFVDNPHWYHASARCIDLPPEGSTKKQRAEYKERTIRLTKEGCDAVELLISINPPHRSRFAMRDAFLRAAAQSIGTKGISPKMFRKTLISWLVECKADLGIDALDIGASAGHSLETLRVHYLGAGFQGSNRILILEYLRGWGKA